MAPSGLTNWGHRDWGQFILFIWISVWVYTVRRTLSPTLGCAKCQNATHGRSSPAHQKHCFRSPGSWLFTWRLFKRFVFGARAQFPLKFYIWLHKWAPKPIHLNRYDPELYLLSWTSRKMFTDLWNIYLIVGARSTPTIRKLVDFPADKHIM